MNQHKTFKMKSKLMRQHFSKPQIHHGPNLFQPIHRITFILDELKNNQNHSIQKVTILKSGSFYQRLSYFILFYLFSFHQTKSHSQILQTIIKILNRQQNSQLFPYSIAQNDNQSKRIYETVHKILNLPSKQIILNQLNNNSQIDELMCQLTNIVFQKSVNNPVLVTFFTTFGFRIKRQTEYQYSIQNYNIQILSQSQFRIYDNNQNNITLKNNIIIQLHNPNTIGSNAETRDSKCSKENTNTVKTEFQMKYSIIQQLTQLILSQPKSPLDRFNNFNSFQSLSSRNEPTTKDNSTVKPNQKYISSSLKRQRINTQSMNDKYQQSQYFIHTNYNPVPDKIFTQRLYENPIQVRSSISNGGKIISKDNKNNLVWISNNNNLSNIPSQINIGFRYQNIQKKQGTVISKRIENSQNPSLNYRCVNHMISPFIAHY